MNATYDEGRGALSATFQSARDGDPVNEAALVKKIARGHVMDFVNKLDNWVIDNSDQGEAAYQDFVGDCMADLKHNLRLALKQANIVDPAIEITDSTGLIGRMRSFKRRDYKVSIQYGGVDNIQTLRIQVDDLRMNTASYTTNFQNGWKRL